jgi:protein-S-isoprenylcysteine O-methyltransferase Ste14
MRRTTAAIGSSVFFLLAPGTLVGVVPWWITRWQPRGAAPVPLRALGVALLGAGLVVLISAFVRFVAEGSGTPAPVAPPERLVVGGLYRYVRNPMYLAVVATIVGQALWLGYPILLRWATVVGLGMFAFVRLYEEPTLRERFGADYEAYRRAVPGWWPRLRPWMGPSTSPRR